MITSQPTPLSCTYNITSWPNTSYPPAPAIPFDPPLPPVTFSCSHTTTTLPQTGVPIIAIARDNTPICVYTHACRTCHRSYCEAAQKIIEVLYLPRITGYNMRVERMTEIIESGEGGREMVEGREKRYWQGIEMVEAREKRYWQGMEVWEQMVSVVFWVWKPFFERWGVSGFFEGLGEDFEG